MLTAPIAVDNAVPTNGTIAAAPSASSKPAPTTSPSFNLS